MKTSDQIKIVEEELKLLKPQLTRAEWFTLRDVLAVSLARVVAKVSEATPECTSPCIDNYCPVHGIAATKEQS